MKKSSKVTEVISHLANPLSHEFGTGVSNLVLEQRMRNSGEQTVQLGQGFVTGGAVAVALLGLVALFDNVSYAGTNTGAQNLARLRPLATHRSKFFDDLAEYEVDDWDGDGAKAISNRDANNARMLLDAIALFTPFAADIVAGADGSICMEWLRHSLDGERKIFVDVGPDGRILTYVKFGSHAPIEKHFDSYGPNVVEHLQVLFNVFSAG